MPSSERTARVAFRLLPMTLACALALPCLMQAPAALAHTVSSSASAIETAGSDGAGQAEDNGVPGIKTGASVTLQQCETASVQTERSATFAGEMTAIPGTARMEMSIDLLERIPGEPQYRMISAPGLGVWRASAPGVKIYTHLQQVTNLSAPAFYRGAVRFRWLNAKGRPIKSEELRTPRCEQPAPSPTTGTTTTSTSTPSEDPASG
jgi:hypothetical protein